MADNTKIFNPGWRAEDDDGVIVAGGTLEFFAAGTTDPLEVFSDANLSISLGVTVDLNGGGYPVSSGGSRVLVYTGTDAYRVRLKDEDGVVVWEHDNISGALDTGDFDAVIAAQFPSGTVMLFGQTNAPPGWTKSVSLDDAVPRIVSGTASDGGSAGFSSAFGNRTLTRAMMPNQSVSITVTDTGHVHQADTGSTAAGEAGGVFTCRRSGSNNVASNTTGITAAFNFNGNTTQVPLEFNPKYRDFIVATKD